jgi:hypothetical protein
VRISRNTHRIRRLVLTAGSAALTAALCFGTLGMGTAFAADKHHDDAGVHSGFTPTSPVDGFADHWEKYHKGKDMTQEPKTITSDPGNYAKIHQEMAGHMLGN